MYVFAFQHDTQSNERTYEPFIGTVGFVPLYETKDEVKDVDTFFILVFLRFL